MRNSVAKTFSHMILPCAVMGVILVGCDDDKPVDPPGGGGVTEPEITEVDGFYLLNEGTMGQNKASLDYFDATTGVYTTNIYPSRNPGVALELGDVGNDLVASGSYLYAVINGSDKVEVMNLDNAVRVGQTNIQQPRYVTSYGDYVYVSSYKTGTDGVGSVYKIDPKTLQIFDRVDVGYEPEEMAVSNGKLYVANSGGMYAYEQGGAYDRTVSVIDLNKFEVIKNIDVAVNLHRLCADSNGRIYVSSRGNYADVASDLFVIDTRTDKVIKAIGCPVADICINKDKAYTYSSSYDQNWNATYSYNVIDLNTLSVMPGGFITDGTESRIMAPYGLAVNPVSGDIFVTDARNYTSSGAVYCFSADGKLKWTHNTGVIPGHIAFKGR